MRTALALLFALLLDAARAYAQPAIDTSNGGAGYSATVSTTTSISVAVTTAAANEEVIVCTGVGSTSSTPPQITSVTGGGLTFTLLGRTTASGSTSAVDTECYGAHAATALSAVTLTATFATTFDDACILAFGVTGTNATPFDSNVSLPATASQASGTASTLSVTASTTNAHDLLLYATATNSSTTYTTAGTGFTYISRVANNGGTNYARLMVSFQAVTTVQTGASFAATGTTVTPPQSAFLVAATSDPPPAPTGTSVHLLPLLGVGQ